MDYQIFPGGRRKAVTFGFDDGEIHDRRLAEMLRQYGLKATFFLVSALTYPEPLITLDTVDMLTPASFATS
mgnify:CR=1 FL=1